MAFNWSALFCSHKKLGFTKSLLGKSLGDEKEERWEKGLRKAEGEREAAGGGPSLPGPADPPSAASTLLPQRHSGPLFLRAGSTCNRHLV